MSCSKEVRAPRKWVQRQREMQKVKVDDNLISMDELIELVVECGLCDEASVKKMYERTNTYQFMWTLIPTVPSDQWQFEIFKTSLHFLCALFLVDDAVESYSEKQMKEMSDAYDMLEKQVCEKFPCFPSINEMKQSLKHLNNPFDIASITFCMHYVNKIASVLVNEGSTPQNVVYNFRRRTSNAISISFQAVLIKAKLGSNVTGDEMLWRRVYDGLVILFYQFGELVLGLTKNTEKYMTVITELRLLGCLYCIVINDLYSYHRDKLVSSDNIIKTWLLGKVVSNLSEASSRCCEILDAVMQYMHERVERIRQSYPGCPELEALLETTVYTTVGWIFAHTAVVPRYSESPLKVHLVEVEESELHTWFCEKNHYGRSVIQKFLKAVNDEKHKGILDALSGFVDGRGQLLKTQL